MKRKIWTPQDEFDAAGFPNGCLPQDDYDLEVFEELQSSSVSFSTLYRSGDMPIIKWDSDFERYIDSVGEQTKMMMKERTQCIWPWEVLKNLPADRKGGDLLYFSQGSRPSCMGHADDFAYRSSVLSQIALGAPLIYEPTNPYVTWVISKNGSQSGGQSPAPQAKAANLHGHFLTSEVGSNNLAMPSNYKQHTESAKRHQSGIVFIPGSGKELALNILRCLLAGLCVPIGNSTAVSGTFVDENGVEVVILRGSWAHATCFVAVLVIGNQIYIFWVNSHGKIYKRGTFGEPFDGAWMRYDKEFLRFLATSTRYGQPYAVIPETVWTQKNKLGLDVRVPFPKAWRK